MVFETLSWRDVTSDQIKGLVAEAVLIALMARRHLAVQVISCPPARSQKKQNKLFVKTLLGWR